MEETSQNQEASLQGNGNSVDETFPAEDRFPGEETAREDGVLPSEQSKEVSPDSARLSETPLSPLFTPKVPPVVTPASPLAKDCSNCSGSGLIKNGWGVDEICPVCIGKGKVH